MPRLRIIPTILLRGSTAVKGQGFDNWRVVGTAQAVATLHGSRKVDELVILDVGASSDGRLISPRLINSLASRLSIPFAVGGGIGSVADAAKLFEAGADKIIIGNAWRSNSELISQLSNTFGSQSVCCTIDSISPDQRVDSTWKKMFGENLKIQKAGQRLQDFGAGEILFNTVSLDGKMLGMDYEGIHALAEAVDIPIIASSGANKESFALAYDAGASAVGAGALFQFTEVAPSTIRNELAAAGYDVRQKIV